MNKCALIKYSLWLFIFAVLILNGCEKQKSEQNTSTDQSNQAAVEKTTVEKLQGKWQSLDDSKNVVEFAGNVKTEYYDDQVMATSNFEIIDKCRSGFSKPDIEGEFIDDGELCHKIEEITGQSLILIYMDRGNILRYKKL